MNSRHTLALLLAMAIGAAIWIVVGYIAHAAASGAAGAMRFSSWVTFPFHRNSILNVSLLDIDAFWWGLSGAAIGASVFYFKRLTSNWNAER